MFTADALILAARPSIDGNVVIYAGIALIILFAISAIYIVHSWFSVRPQTTLVAAAYGACLILGTIAGLYLVFQDNSEITSHSSYHPDEGGFGAFLVVGIVFTPGLYLIALVSIIALITGLIRLLVARRKGAVPFACPECGCLPPIPTDRCPNCGEHLSTPAQT